MKVECSCGQSVEVSDTSVGHDVHCPLCGREIELPKTLDVMGNPVDEDEGELLIAHDAADEPLVVAIDSPPRPVATARPASGSANGNGRPAGKQQDMLPLFIVGVGVVLLVFVLVIVVLNGGGPTRESRDPDENYRQQLDATARKQKVETPEMPDTGSGSGFFSNVPDGRTSKDYEEEKQRRLNGDP
ncbi:MAG: hypothetical protein JXL80_02200 [Planctomycetes bacterium]|nr:hypothetical protein [Planctomycetota bacterium]